MAALSVFRYYSASFVTSFLTVLMTPSARPASPWISLGMMILVARPLAAAVKASSALILMTASVGLA